MDDDSNLQAHRTMFEWIEGGVNSVSMKRK